MFRLLNRPAGFAALLSALIALPITAFAATSDFFGPIIPQSGVCLCAHTAMDWGCVLQVVQGVTNMVISFGTLLVILVIAYGGFMLMVSGSNPGTRTEAKNRLLNAVVGLALVLFSWLIVDYVMKIVYDPTTANFGPWNSILAGTGGDECITPNNNPLNLTDGNILNLGTAHSSAPGVIASAGGTCKVPVNANNPCSAQSLSNTCFAAKGAGASQVCNMESGGQAAIPSGSDKLNNGSGPSYSWGLWQINLTTTVLQTPSGPLDCRPAFTNPCSGQFIHGQAKVGSCNSAIRDQVLYNKCVSAAQNPQINSQTACKLYTPSLGAWACSASRCSVPGAKTLSQKGCAPGT